MDCGVVSELGEAMAFDVNGARFAAFVVGAGSDAAVPCLDCGDAAFSLCVCDEDDGVCAGATPVLLAESSVAGVRWKSKSRSDLGRSVSCGEIFEFCCCVFGGGKGAGETPAVRTSGALASLLSGAGVVDDSAGVGRRRAVRRSGARASLLSGGAVLFARSRTAPRTHPGSSTCRAPTEEAASAESDCVFGGGTIVIGCGR